MIVATEANTARRLYTQTDFPAHEFIARRARVAQSIGEGATAVVAGAAQVAGFDVFRQSNDMFYLTGVETPHAYLHIEGGSGKSTLYLPAINAKLERSDGPQLSAEDAALAIRTTGCDDVRPLTELGVDLASAQAIFTPHSLAECRQACRDSLKHVWHAIEADPWDQRPTPEARFRERLRGIAPAAEIRDLSPILDRQRMIKSPAEIRLMRRAGYLSALAVTEAMRATQPGVMEYQLAAIGEYVYLVNGAKGASYRPIVAGGANIWNAHYYRNNSPLAAGELVLMDCAPDYGYYTSDIGRYWPVSGTYNAEQRQMYGFMVEYHKVLLTKIRPGVTPAQILAEAAGVMESVIAATRWIRPSFEKAARATLTFAGHLSHTVGMAVHDVGDYRGAPLVPGTVFALDPQLWIPEEQLYFRVEDTVVVTEDGVENLTVAAPLELDDVERTMREPGVMELVPRLVCG